MFISSYLAHRSLASSFHFLSLLFVSRHEWDKFHSMAQAKGDPMLAPTDDMDNIMENVDDEPKTEPQS